PLRLRKKDQRVWRKEIGERDTLELLALGHWCAVDWEDDRELSLACRALRDEIEVTKLDDLVAPELQAYGVGHAEAIDVDDSPAHAELRDVLDHGHPLEPHREKMSGDVLGTPNVALAELEAGLLNRARQPRALQERASRSEQDADVPA